MSAMTSSDLTSKEEALVARIEARLCAQGWVEQWLHQNLKLVSDGHEDGYPTNLNHYILGDKPKSLDFSDEPNLRDLLVKGLAQMTVQVLKESALANEKDMQQLVLAMEEDAREPNLQQDQWSGLQQWAMDGVDHISFTIQILIVYLLASALKGMDRVDVQFVPKDVATILENNDLEALLSEAARGVSSPLRATLKDQFARTFMTDEFMAHVREIASQIPEEARERVSDELSKGKLTQFTLKQVLVHDFCSTWLNDVENLRSIQEVLAA